jgi:hypothetical protein
MTEPRFLFDVRSSIGLIGAIIETLWGNAYLSSEGDLSRFDPRSIKGAPGEETAVLRRNTLDPGVDFVVLPLEADTKDLISKRLLPRLGMRKRVIHVQVEKEERLESGAYDTFHPECTWIGSCVGEALLQSLAQQGFIRSFKPLENPSGVL